MRIKFGTPDLLILYSFLMFQHSVTLSAISLILGLMGSTFCYIQERDDKNNTSRVEITKKEIL